jgi:hypothetical protein
MGEWGAAMMHTFAMAGPRSPWQVVFRDALLRRLVLRFVLCRAALSLHLSVGGRAGHWAWAAVQGSCGCQQQGLQELLLGFPLVTWRHWQLCAGDPPSPLQFFSPMVMYAHMSRTQDCPADAMCVACCFQVGQNPAYLPRCFPELPREMAPDAADIVAGGFAAGASGAPSKQTTNAFGSWLPLAKAYSELCRQGSVAIHIPLFRTCQNPTCHAQLLCMLQQLCWLGQACMVNRVCVCMCAVSRRHPAAGKLLGEGRRVWRQGHQLQQRVTHERGHQCMKQPSGRPSLCLRAAPSGCCRQHRCGAPGSCHSCCPRAWQPAGRWCV